MNNPNVHYAIAGVGEKKEFLIELSKTLGVSEQVHLLGYRKDVVSLFKISDLYVHPSLREGLPVAVMEALAAGTTVLASNIRGCEDVIIDNLFDPNDLDSLLKKLQNYQFNGVLHEMFAQKNVVERVVGLHENIALTEYK